MGVDSAFSVTSPGITSVCLFLFGHRYLKSFYELQHNKSNVCEELLSLILSLLSLAVILQERPFLEDTQNRLKMT